MAITLNGDSGILGAINSGTAVASTSGTSIDFTGIPAGVKRITVMFNIVSTNGSSPLLVQLGASSITSSGYTQATFAANTAGYYNTTTAGFALTATSTTSAANTYSGTMTICLLGSNTWTESGCIWATGVSNSHYCAGTVALSGTLDRVRITTANGTDTFDAGSINILYE